VRIIVATKYTILDFAFDVLQEAKYPLLYQEIWEAGKDKAYTTKLNLKGKTPWATLGARLFVDVRDNPETRFTKVGKNPAKFFLKSRESEIDKLKLAITRLEENFGIPKKKDSFTERELHPLLAYYAYTNNEFNKGRAIYTKTIYHEKSKKNGYSEWVHPDIVGFYIPIDDWNEKLLELNDISDSNSIKLYSFELKKKIDKANYREYFFQAVSNSSWSNEGYLVAAEIKEDDDLYSELERLSGSFGIGIIKLDIEDIDSSHIVFPAKQRQNLDWQLMNKLCEENPDFEHFIDDITKDFKVKTIHKNQYDKMPEDPNEYIESIQNKVSK
jgi:uncharacterized protein